MRYKTEIDFWLGETYAHPGRRRWVQFDWNHQYPNWLPYRLHRIIEKTMMYIIPIMFSNKILEAVHHLVSGLICGRSLTEISRFIVKNEQGEDEVRNIPVKRRLRLAIGLIITTSGILLTFAIIFLLQRVLG